MKCVCARSLPGPCPRRGGQPLGPSGPGAQGGVGGHSGEISILIRRSQKTPQPDRAHPPAQPSPSLLQGAAVLNPHLRPPGAPSPRRDRREPPHTHSQLAGKPRAGSAWSGRTGKGQRAPVLPGRAGTPPGTPPAPPLGACSTPQPRRSRVRTAELPVPNSWKIAFERP